MSLWEYRDQFLSGLGVTVELTAFAFLGAVLIGTFMATCRISPIAPLRVVGLVYVEIFRNVPLMSLIIVVVYALPEIGIVWSYKTCVIVAMLLVGGSFLCEAIRSGVAGVPAGQIEAARSLGMTFYGVMSNVVLPQAFRSMVQPMVTVFIGILLSSSLAGVVGVNDLTATVSYINNREAKGLLTFMVAAVVYLILSLLAGLVGDRLERRLRVLR
ncbi:amino acid ABC transporter permease [Actinomycetaceae bacterium WB03_NA08]|uniref:Amino acid ABC transporter permease n=1 Tax=Scrofimicrobium canadense TaxID=2652290 RepID=A0A6N7VTW7_9ACTO|nr:amino acid ABC transporter permease [Scrofimicrobium canadense]MSS85214.1 amino acid ABC transporter permease [Scrofimicrobium canadense]